MSEIHINNKIKVSRNFAWFIVSLCTLAIPQIFIEKQSFSEYWSTLLGALISVFALVLMRSGYNKLPRVMMVHTYAILSCISHAYKLAPGQAPLASFMCIQFAFITLPFALYDFSEKRMLLTSMIINTLLLLVTPFANDWFNLPPDGKNYETGPLAYTIYVVAGVIACTPLVISANHFYKRTQELIETNKENEKLTRESAANLWINQNIVAIMELVRKNESVEDICKAVLFKICRELNCGNGTLVLHDNKTQSFKITAQFAGETGKQLQANSAQSLIGEAFRKQETIRLNQVPADYVTVHSGLGNGSPTHLVIMPVSFFKDHIGVMELAAFAPFSERDMEFLNRAVQAIAVAVTSFKTAAETASFVEQLQSQAEELRAKEEELRANLESLTASESATKSIYAGFEKRAADQNESQQQLIKSMTENYNATIKKISDNEFVLEQKLHEAQEELAKLKSKNL